MNNRNTPFTPEEATDMSPAEQDAVIQKMLEDVDTSPEEAEAFELENTIFSVRRSLRGCIGAFEQLSTDDLKALVAAHKYLTDKFVFTPFLENVVQGTEEQRKEWENRIGQGSQKFDAEMRQFILDLLNQKKAD